MKTVIFGPLKKGDLIRFGYSTKKSVRSRHISVGKAARAYGKGTIIKKLNAVAILNKNRNPVVSKIFREDMKYVQSLKR
jgi:hypothetical protein